jgi:hypothetical protein
MGSFKGQYLKAHNAQTQLLIDAGIQVDIEGYPLCSDSWLEKTLSEKQLEDYDNYESKKDLLNHKWRICHYHPDSQLSDPIRKRISEE